tara:strand:- start:212 stop:4711 length:4500 start_codon:yes stop_codon:yes gene_type:complete
MSKKRTIRTVKGIYDRKQPNTKEINPSKYEVSARQLQNLDQYDVFIEDDFNNPKYFNVKYIPEYLTYGNHHFQIDIIEDNDLEFDTFKLNSEVKIEIKTLDNQVIFYDLIDSFYNSDNRLAGGYMQINESFDYVNDRLNDGYFANMIILGQLEGSSIPNEWCDMYNVRMTIPLYFKRDKLNDSPLILSDMSKKPKVITREFIVKDSGEKGSNRVRSYSHHYIDMLQTYGGEIKYIDILVSDEEDQQSYRLQERIQLEESASNMETEAIRPLISVGNSGAASSRLGSTNNFTGLRYGDWTTTKLQSPTDYYEDPSSFYNRSHDNGRFDWAGDFLTPNQKVNWGRYVVGKTDISQSNQYSLQKSSSAYPMPDAIQFHGVTTAGNVMDGNIGANPSMYKIFRHVHEDSLPEIYDIFYNVSGSAEVYVKISDKQNFLTSSIYSQSMDTFITEDSCPPETVYYRKFDNFNPNINETWTSSFGTDGISMDEIISGVMKPPSAAVVPDITITGSFIIPPGKFACLYLQVTASSDTILGTNDITCSFSQVSIKPRMSEGFNTPYYNVITENDKNYGTTRDHKYKYKYKFYNRYLEEANSLYGTRDTSTLSVSTKIVGSPATFEKADTIFVPSQSLGGTEEDLVAFSIGPERKFYDTDLTVSKSMKVTWDKTDGSVNFKQDNSGSDSIKFREDDNKSTITISGSGDGWNDVGLWVNSGSVVPAQAPFGVQTKYTAEGVQFAESMENISAGDFPYRIMDMRYVFGNTSAGGMKWGRGLAFMPTNGLYAYNTVSPPDVSGTAAAALFISQSSLDSDCGYRVGIGTQAPDATLHVLGDIKAENYIVSSSVTHVDTMTLSGSTTFGDTFDDIHSFTGSMILTGSLNLEGSDLSASKIYADDILHVTDQLVVGNHNAGSTQIRIHGKNNYVGSPTDTFTVGFHQDNGAIQFMNTTDYQGVTEKGNLMMKTYHYDDAIYIDNTAENVYLNKTQQGLVVSSSGEASIGRSPLADMKLAVAGDISSSGDVYMSEGKSIKWDIDASPQVVITTDTISDEIRYGTNGSGAFTGHLFRTFQNSQIMHMTASGAATGRVGINKMNPSTTLEVDGNISGSGNLNIDSNITASGNISASGTTTTNGLISDWVTVGNTGLAFNSSYIDNMMRYDSDTDSVKLLGDYTVEGNISSSGTGSFTELVVPAGTLNAISTSYALTASHALNSSGGGGGTPGGSNTQVQFNDGGSFGGDAGFTYNSSTDTATLSGDIIATTGSFTHVSASGDIYGIGKLYLRGVNEGTASIDNDGATFQSGLIGSPAFNLVNDHVDFGVPGFNFGQTNDNLSSPPIGIRAIVNNSQDAGYTGMGYIQPSHSLFIFSGSLNSNQGGASFYFKPEGTRLGINTRHDTPDVALHVSGAISSSGVVSQNVYTLAQNDATPSVAQGNIFTTNNTSNTNITTFTDGVAGQEITIVIQDTNTNFYDGTNLALFRGFNWTTPNTDDVAKFLCIDGTKWVQTLRMDNS